MTGFQRKRPCDTCRRETRHALRWGLPKGTVFEGPPKLQRVWVCRKCGKENG